VQENHARPAIETKATMHWDKTNSRKNKNQAAE
jgi:hypothetical protein